MHFKQVLFLLTAIQGCLGYSCFVSQDQSQTPILQTAADQPNIPITCASYQFTCNANYNFSCSPIEIQQQTSKFTYSFYTNTTCLTLAKDSTLTNLCCCAFDKCNAVGNFPSGCSGIAKNLSGNLKSDNGFGNNSEKNNTIDKTTTSSGSNGVLWMSGWISAALLGLMA